LVEGNLAFYTYSGSNDTLFLFWVGAGEDLPRCLEYLGKFLWDGVVILLRGVPLLTGTSSLLVSGWEGFGSDLRKQPGLFCPVCFGELSISSHLSLDGIFIGDGG